MNSRSALGDLLDHCFDVPPGRHYFDDFPIWDPAVVPEDPSLYRRTTFDQDRLIACAGMLWWGWRNRRLLIATAAAA